MENPHSFYTPYGREKVTKPQNVYTQSLEERKEEFKNEVYSYQEDYPSHILNAFYNFWSEPDKTKTNMKKELQSTYDTSLRLAAWYKNPLSHKRSQPDVPIYKDLF